MTTNGDNSLPLLIAKMEKKRDELLQELEKVQKWLSQMNAFISEGIAIVGDIQGVIIGEGSVTLAGIPGQVNVEVEPPEAKAGRILSLIGKPEATSHPERIRQLFDESGGPLSISEIDGGFLRRQWPIRSKRRHQIIYNTLIRRDDLFVKLGDKLWGLKGRDDKSAQAQ